MKFLVTLVLALFFSVLSHAQVVFGPPVQGTANGTSTKVLNQNTIRAYLIIQNTGSNTISVKFGSVQSGTEGILIAPGGNYEPAQAPNNSVYLITTSSTSGYTVIEGN